MPHPGVYETGLKENWLLIEHIIVCERNPSELVCNALLHVTGFN